MTVAEQVCSADRLRPSDYSACGTGFVNSAPDDFSFWVSSCKSASFSQVWAISEKCDQSSGLPPRAARS